MEGFINEQEAVALCNSALAIAGVTHHVAAVSKVRALGANVSLFVAATEVLLGRHVDKIHRRPSNVVQRSANCAAVLSALEQALCGVSLSHISPSAVVSGDLLHITSMLELITELARTPEVLHQASHKERSVADRRVQATGGTHSNSSAAATDARLQPAPWQSSKTVCEARDLISDEQGARKQKHSKRHKASPVPPLATGKAAAAAAAEAAAAEAATRGHARRSLSPEAAAAAQASAAAKAPPAAPAVGDRFASPMCGPPAWPVDPVSGRGIRQCSASHHAEQLQEAVVWAASLLEQQQDDSSIVEGDTYSSKITSQSQPPPPAAVAAAAAAAAAGVCELDMQLDGNSSDSVSVDRLFDVEYAELEAERVLEDLRRANLGIQQCKSAAAAARRVPKTVSAQIEAERVLEELGRVDIEIQQQMAATAAAGRNEPQACCTDEHVAVQQQRSQQQQQRWQQQQQHGDFEAMECWDSHVHLEHLQDMALSIAELQAAKEQLLLVEQQIQHNRQLLQQHEQQQQQQEYYLQPDWQQAVDNSSTSSRRCSSPGGKSCVIRELDASADSSSSSSSSGSSSSRTRSSRMLSEDSQQQQQLTSNRYLAAWRLQEIVGPSYKCNSSSSSASPHAESQHLHRLPAALSGLQQQQQQAGSRPQLTNKKGYGDSNHAPGAARLRRHSRRSGSKGKPTAKTYKRKVGRQATAPASSNIQEGQQARMEASSGCGLQTCSQPQLLLQQQQQQQQQHSERYMKAAAAVAKVQGAKVRQSVAQQQLLQQQILKHQAAAVRRQQIKQEQQQQLTSTQEVHDSKVAVLRAEQRKDQQRQEELQKQAQAAMEAAEKGGEGQDSHTARPTAAEAKAAGRLKHQGAKAGACFMAQRTFSPKRVLRSNSCSPVKRSVPASANPDALLQLQQLQDDYTDVLSVFEDLLVSERRGRVEAERLLAQLTKQLRTEGRCCSPIKPVTH